jgi:hypothetical protein
MDLTQRFRFAASKTNIQSPTMELNKRYPILFAYKHFVSSANIITLFLEAEDKSMEYLVLEPHYSLVFKQDDITDINSEK